MSIKTKILACFLLPSIIIVTTTVAFYHYYIQKALTQNIFNQLEICADELEEHVKSFLEEKRKRSVGFSADGLIRQYTKEIIMKENREKYYSTALNTYLFRNKMPLDHDIIESFIVDLNGRIISSTNNSQVGKNVSHTRYFQTTMKRGYYTSDLYYSPEFRQNTFEVTNLIADEDENPIGIIVNLYSGDSIGSITYGKDLKKFKSKIWHDGLGETGELYIVNSNKIMITESRFIESAVLIQDVDTEGVRTALDNRIGTTSIYTNYRNIQVLGVSKYLEDMGWVLLAEKNTSEVFTPIASLRKLTLIIGAMGITIIVTVAILISTRITRPIKKLIDGTKRIANGDLDNPIPLGKRTDELNELGKAFNIMMKELGESILENKQLFLLVKRGRDEWVKTFDAITDIITIHDKDFTILRANNSFFEKFNINKRQLPSKRCYEIFHGNENPWHSCPLERSKKSLKQEIEEIEDSHMGGSFLISVYPLKNEIGEVYGFVHLAKDITFQKKVEKQLIEKANELKTVNKELEDFVYIVSHDLKEPLFAIEGYTSRLLKTHSDSLDDKGKLYINRTKVNIEKMSQKIQEIMEVLKVGRIAYNFKNNDSNVIAREVVNALESKITNNKINISIQEDMPVIQCDENRIKDVLSNLITNAIKFMGDDKQRQVKIGCNKNGSYHKFYVEDTGIGIKEEYRDQIFKIFRRLKEIETEGTGVGLAIVKKIVEQHKGSIWVEGPVKDGKGSRFCFTIPINGENISCHEMQSNA